MTRLLLSLSLAVTVLFGLIGSSVAAETPKSFLDAIYAKYVGPPAKAKGIRLDSRTALNRYFTPALAGLIDADNKAAAKKNEVPNLDGDPFVDAQDWQITDVSVMTSAVGPGKASGVAAFKNFGEPVTVGYNLVLLKDGWRIDDMHWASGDLRALFKGR